MAAVAKRFDGWRPAAETIRRVQSVPTRFLQYDHRLGVGGQPIARITLVHGPSNEGKTAFVLGLMESFLARDHFAGFVDAERTTPLPWVQTMMRGLEHHPGFMTLPARSYEQVVGGVRKFCDTIGDARVKGQIDQNTTGIIVVDSIRKLVPEGLLKKMLAAVKDDDAPKRGRSNEKKPKGIDGAGGRAAQMKAAINSQWMDELVPLLADTNTAIAIIAREMDDPDAGMYDRPWKIAGGKALYYDASVDVRVSRSWVKEGSDDSAQVVGERHRLEIHKTKVAGKASKVPAAYFHTSNGVLVPEGFDTPRDVLELGTDAGLITQSGAWYIWGKKRIANGRANAVKRLHAEPEFFAAIEADVREYVRQATETKAASSIA
jgi:recombination protein RecA